MNEGRSSLKSYVVVARARSSLTLPSGAHLHVAFTGGTRTSHVFAATRLIRLAELNIPRGVFFECRCEAEAIKEAVDRQAELTDMLAGLMAVAGNAFVDHVMPELCFEITVGNADREFFQGFLQEHAQLGTGTRQLLEQPAIAFITAILSHKERDRLLRATSHYRDALENWTVENRLRCILHLYVAVEAMTQVALRREMERHSLDVSTLARRYGLTRLETDGGIISLAAFEET